MAGSDRTSVSSVDGFFLRQGSRAHGVMLGVWVAVAMALVGITSLDQAHPGLVNTNDVDYLVPRTEGHPYARKMGKPFKAKM